MKKDDRASVSALVVGLLMSFIACAGLALDGGRIITTRVRVGDYAENAARVGVQEVTDIRTGIPRIDTPQAVRLVRQFLSKSGTTGSVTANAVEVCVAIHESVQMTLLALVGVQKRDIVAERCARPIGAQSP